MGISASTVRFLSSEVRRKVAFGRMLTLGHQGIYMDRAQYARFVEQWGGSVSDPEYADDLLQAMGASAVDVMDASQYEKANVVHDLNEPLNSALFEQYDTVFDGGTLEHVFNYPEGLRSCLQMVKVGGYFITVTPFNNWCGHGFYQLSPELLYSALSPANGFRIERMLLADGNRWFAVRNPDEARSRIELRSGRSMEGFVSAKRVEKKAIFEKWPQQSDYARAWNEVPELKSDALRMKLREKAVNAIPPLGALQSWWRAFKARRQGSLRNRNSFRPVALD